MLKFVGSTTSRSQCQYCGYFGRNISYKVPEMGLTKHGKLKFCGKIAKYLENTSLHGFRYIVDQQATVIERLLWFVICGMCVVCLYFLFGATWRAYRSNPISFVTETTYLDWNTTFPGVAVCESPNGQKIEAFAEYIKGPEQQGMFSNLLNSLFIYTGCQFCETQCQKLPELCDVDVQELMTGYYTPCEFLITNCFWNNKEFECCSRFKHLKTQLGPCYIINSMQTPEAVRTELLTANKENWPVNLKFQLQEKADVSIIATEEVPFTNRPIWQHKILEYGSNYTLSFQMIEIVNDVLLSELSVQQRQCRFSEENDQHLYPYYSFSACVIDCIARQQLALCGCYHHFLPVNHELACNISGLGCLYTNWNLFEKVQIADSPSDPDAKHRCDCPPSCSESEYELVLEQEQVIDDSPASYYTINMENLPTKRYIRNVVRTPLDLVVSLGGAAGLFLGASLISIVELVYYFCIR